MFFFYLLPIAELQAEGKRSWLVSDIIYSRLLFFDRELPAVWNHHIFSSVTG